MSGPGGSAIAQCPQERRSTTGVLSPYPPLGWYSDHPKAVHRPPNRGNSTGAESETLRLGNTQTRTFLAGITGAGVSGSPVYINSSGQLGLLSSSARVKRDIKPVGPRSQALSRLRPVSFY